MRKTIVVMTLLACVAWMPRAVADDVDAAEAFLGSWKIEMDFQGRTVESKLTIKKNDDGTLGGTWESRRGKNDLNDVKIVDGQLHFARTMNRQGMEMTIESTAKIEEGKLAGIMSTQRGDMEFIGVRPKDDEGAEEQAAESPRHGGAASMLERLDANGDGKIQESEAPERMKQFFGMIDSNGDGELDADELEVMAQFRRQQQGNN